MTKISAQLVQELRKASGAGMMDCKKALSECNGSFDEAMEYLQKKGLKDIGKRAGKVAAQGTIGVYSHNGDQIVAIVELNCETDFVGRGEDFKQLARDLAMHVAAAAPEYLSREQVPAEVIESQKALMAEQLSDKQKSDDNIKNKILEGRLAKFFEETCLLDQIFVKDDTGKITISSMIDQLSASTKEKCQLRRFQRFQVGEGIEKESGVSFAEEVAATIGAS